MSDLTEELEVMTAKNQALIGEKEGLNRKIKEEVAKAQSAREEL